jgi:hypothetical protein
MTEINKTKQKPIIRMYFAKPEHITKFLEYLQMKGDFAI